MAPTSYPGTPEHQRFLRTAAEHYATDPRVLAVCVFGSLGRGGWDDHSDVDLDVVVTDDAAVDVDLEVRRLCAALQLDPVVVDRDGLEAADVLLPSLMEFSVRYHRLGTTSPNVVDSLVVVAGPLDAAAIRAAGLANQRRLPGPSEHVATCLRLAATLDARLHRRRFWLAYQVLYQARLALLMAYARARGGTRPYHVLEADESPALRTRLAATLGGEDLPSLQRAFLSLLDLLERDLPSLTAGQVDLDDAQRRAVTDLRRRQARLNLESSAR